MLTKKKRRANKKMSFAVEKPDCMAAMVEEVDYRVGERGTILVGERRVKKGDYCMDRDRVRVCNDSR